MVFSMQIREISQKKNYGEFLNVKIDLLKKVILDSVRGHYKQGVATKWRPFKNFKHEYKV